MREQGWGKVVNVSSMGGRFTFPGGGLYHASKYALEALSDAMRFELKGFGVDVILIEPGLIRTGFGAVVEREIGSATADRGPYADFNQAVGEATVGAYEKGLLARLGGTARGGRRDHRARARRQAAAGPVYGHSVGQGAAGDQRGAARRGVGRDAAELVPEPRQTLTT